MQAIETRYKGYRFRSRLEARWAVFFDAIGVRWEYEPQGFETEAGPYLPDFKLSTLGLYVEIKSPESDLSKPRAFGWKTNAIVVFEGLPGEKGTLFCHDVSGSGGGTAEYRCEWTVFFNQETNDGFGFLFAPDATGATLWQPYHREELRGVVPGVPNPRFPLIERRDLASVGFTAARGARFEHGETPQF